MKQLTQQLGSGEMHVQEVPIPQINEGMVLVKNHFSIISSGTESSTVKAARSNLLQKISERPEQVKQVIDSVTKLGIVQTYRAVQKKLDAYSPLGYSSAGEVIGIGPDVKGFKIGDKVACAGATYANHAEIVSVPSNLCVRVSDSADLLKASYNTLGAISLQGIRQADLKLGEVCAVIGLGLLGQLTGIMLNANGVTTIGIDLTEDLVLKAKQNSFDYGWVRNEPGILDAILAITHGMGVDAVIITAASQSLDPVNFAGQISRTKGKVIIVGAVPTGFNREFYYKKELELKMSCSYGPGRYDLNYEEKGLDYPFGYVRWTENRNMQAFQQLVHSNKININYLTSHVFDFDKAPDAYDLILSKKEPYLGIVLKYDTNKTHVRKPMVITDNQAEKSVNIGFIGAGNYAQSHLLPNLAKKREGVLNVGIVTNTGTTSKRIAEKYNFSYCTDDVEQLLHDGRVNSVFIATRHDSHAKFVIDALKCNKNIFVEKPLCLNEAELESIREAFSSTNKYLMVGYNRRFSPLSIELKKHILDMPLSASYRINSGNIPSNSWIQDIKMGGGRIVGEVCHFIDYLIWITNSLPKNAYAISMPDPDGNNDTLSITLAFKNGSVGVINYFSNGSKAMPKESIEIFQNGTSMILSDFLQLDMFKKTKSRKKLMNQDKGQKNMMEQLLETMAKGTKPLISFEEIYYSTLTTFKILESLKIGQIVNIA